MPVHASTVAKRQARSLVVAMLLAMGPASTCPAEPLAPESVMAESPVDWVNPYIGTAGSAQLGSEYGGTMPFVGPPFATTNWTAQTRQNKISQTSYAYEDTTISGFIGTHQPAIWMGDYGYFTVVPEVGELKVSPEARSLHFERRDEHATPYDYSVRLGDGTSEKVLSEMTASDHCAYFRFTFLAQAHGHVFIEAARPGVIGSAQAGGSDNEISGENNDRMDAHLSRVKLPNFKGYFIARFRQMPSASGVLENGRTLDGTAVTGSDGIGAYATFDTAEHPVVEMKLCESFISTDSARQSLASEMPVWDFDQVRQTTRDRWNAVLGKVSLEGASDDERHIFYSAMFHALLYPKLFSENGKYYSAFDDKVHNGTSYTAYSTWDVYRAEFSWLTLVAPERISPMIQALLQDYKEGGWMPKWPNPGYTNIMIGTHADSLVAEAMQKGFTGFDRDLAFAAVWKDATVPPDGDTTRRWGDRAPEEPYEARAGLTYARQLGYVPADKIAESASSTLEETYDDYAAAQVAFLTHHKRDGRMLLKRSLGYKNLFNPATGFMQARNSDGTWAKPDEGWTEGDPWNYLFAPVHDIAGVANLLGSRAAFTDRLDTLFAEGHNNHSNEPSHHYPYLYDFAGQPWKTQAMVRGIAASAYSNRPDGITGNEDCGQMSAWYLFAAMGFYPVNPSSGVYMIGSPLFHRIRLQLDGGRAFVVTAENNSADNIYIQSATLNGRPLNQPDITYAQIAGGGRLDLVMGPTPSTWAAAWRPQALSSTAH